MSIRDIFDQLTTTFGKPMPVAVAMCQNNIVQSAGTTRDPTQNLGCAFHLFLVPDWPHFLKSSDF